MKKSQLRNIIRESIKELINEQISPNCMAANMIPACPDQGTAQYRGWYSAGQQVSTITLGGTGGTPVCLKINGQDITSANIGDLIYANPPYPPGPTGAVHPSHFAGGSECDVYQIIGIIDPLAYYNSPPTSVINAVPAVCGNPNTPCEIGGTSNPIAGGGCTDQTAQNYDPNATIDDGSCIANVYGCSDPAALNYYAGVNIDDGSCTYSSGTSTTVTDPVVDPVIDPKSKDDPEKEGKPIEAPTSCDEFSKMTKEEKSDICEECLTNPNSFPEFCGCCDDSMIKERLQKLANIKK